MGDFKDINDGIFEDLLNRLDDEGYSNIPSQAHNEIVDLIDAQYEDAEMFKELVSEAIKIIKKHQ
ncbi:hypothetical protein Z959_07905 [Clostridium novyi B str. ATCC 27606]|uniref:Uncharacterized protein n=1 Tax=Clostridium novyi B str. ATCC 27606 TaxID=1443123 RepID=A0AA40IUM3_CLONO|nr:hypothetical protein [Clostridium novyi]KEI16993.1 hypothetical protein Z959_07905 [Clostridium novyi B str. ATCC 27606]